MREVSFVKRLKFNFDGSVTKRALVIGDADNDLRNELVCANLQGDLAIFKGKNEDKFAYADNLGMVTACSIGDIINSGKNHVTAINMEGWLFIFDVIADADDGHQQRDAPTTSREPADTNKKRLIPMYEQRMPANCKEMLLADLDGDGQNELIIGLTDRVLRTYKWVKIGPEQGKFVGLYKWEFADQIGSISLNPSRHKNCQDIIVAQPGGTYAKLECFDKKPLASSKSASSSLDEPLGEQSIGQQQQHHVERGGPLGSLSLSQQGKDNATDPGDDVHNVRTEYVNKLTPEYHQLALSQMRNHHVSTEVLGNIRDNRESNSCSLIVIATLDGTLMLVNKDEILWSLQVDHQLFALAVLETGRSSHQLPSSDSTCTIVPMAEFNNSTSVHARQHEKRRGEGERERDRRSGDCLATPPDSQKRSQQHFVACAWNGKTYIIDEERNYLRFKFGEAVSAFTAGNYHFHDEPHSSLVYATFNNQIILYYDVLLNTIRPIYLLNEIMNNPEYEDLLGDLHKLVGALEPPNENALPQEDSIQEENQKTLKLCRALSEILYSFKID